MLNIHTRKQFEDILDDFSIEQRMEYEQFVERTLASLAEEHGDDTVYWDLYDWCLK